MKTVVSLSAAQEAVVWAEGAITAIRRREFPGACPPITVHLAIFPRYAVTGSAHAILKPRSEGLKPCPLIAGQVAIQVAIIIFNSFP
jgi:hypothetical protein